jgi:hypothetical protein
MTITTHAAIGAVIGTSVGNPVLGFILGGASHFLVDMIPHGDVFLADDYRIHKKHFRWTIAYGIADMIIGILLLMLLGLFLDSRITQSAVYIASIAGSILPDILVGITDLVKNRLAKAYYKFHFFFHDFFSRKHGDVKLHYALLAQTAFIIIVIIFLT